ncbi:hypothetical protein DFQ28_009411 [Apophysomyces sp. BC1034]|nr:hypothetical protein DFQ28_009411 [Apophysomyces sp. BC1034]
MLSEAVSTERLDLRKVFNNQAFGEGGDFDGLGNYFMRDNITNPSLLVPFDVQDTGLDNMVADGQEITLSNASLGAIYLLVSASHGPVTADVEVIYMDGIQTNTVLSLPDWQTSHLDQMDRADVLFSKACNGVSAALFSMPIFVDPLRRVQSIRFPNAKELHVFAATMYQVQPLQIISVRPTFRFQDGSRIVTARIHNTSPDWIKGARLQMEGDYVITTEEGIVNCLAPGHVQLVDVAVQPLHQGTELANVEIITENGQVLAFARGRPLDLSFDGYKPNDTSLQRHEAPLWLRNAKFGIFIHWGLYSVPAWSPVGKAYAEWYWWNMNTEPTKSYHRKHYGTQFSYDDFIQQWQPVAFDPRAWLDLIDKSHARYFVFTAKHHDGIALFNTSVTHRSTSSLPPHRDFVRELLDEAKKNYSHLKRGLYFSLPEWYNPSYHDGSSGWGGPPKNPYTNKTIPYTGAFQIQDFVNELQLPQAQELIRDYDPAIFWYFLISR